MRKAERKKMDAFEMSCWRRVMSVMDGEKKQCMGAGNIKPKRTLESRVAQAVVRYFGHAVIVVRQERGRENDVMVGEMMEREGEEGQEQDGWTM